MHILSFNARRATLELGVFDTASATPLMESTIGPPAVGAAAFDEIERRLREASVAVIDAIGHRVAHKGCLAAALGALRRAPLIAVGADPVAAVARTQHVHSKS